MMAFPVFTIGIATTIARAGGMRTGAFGRAVVFRPHKVHNGFTIVIAFGHH